MAVTHTHTITFDGTESLTYDIDKITASGGDASLVVASGYGDASLGANYSSDINMSWSDGSPTANVVGNPGTRQLPETAASSSNSSGKSSASPAANSATRSRLSPTSTPSTTTRCSRNRSQARCNEGISARQGGHHTAQKLTTTTLPR